MFFGIKNECCTSCANVIRLCAIFLYLTLHKYKKEVGVIGVPLYQFLEKKVVYSKNKQYNRYEFESFEAAFVTGKTIANSLRLDLLDATEKGNFKWIDKTEA